MKSFVRRIRKIEQYTTQPRWRVVVKDTDCLYRGECGEGLSEAQFEAWVKLQEEGTQIIIVEVCEDTSPDLPASEKSVTFKVENHADKNLQDTLKEYQEIIEKVTQSYLPTKPVKEQAKRTHQVPKVEVTH